MNKTFSITLLGVFLILAGCAPVETKRPVSNLVASSNQAAEALVSGFQKQKEATKPSVVVATFVNNDNFSETSSLGRIIPEQIAGRLAQLGFSVTEVKLRSGLLMKGNQGELGLTRELKDSLKPFNTEFVVIGTYTESVKNVYVSTKLIQLENSLLAGAHSFTIPKDEDVSALLHGLKSKDKYYEENGEPTQTTLFETIKEYDRQINLKRKIH